MFRKTVMRMVPFGVFYLDKEKDIVVTLSTREENGRCIMDYVLRTPNHATGNLITNLARLCHLPLSMDENGLLIIRGTLPCYIDSDNHPVYVFRLLDTKVANIYPDGRIQRKASIPAISKTLMSQTKDYRLDFKKTVVKTYILEECKFRTDLHTHMNANLSPDVLIALGIRHQIRYPLYYIRKLGLTCTPEQEEMLTQRHDETAQRFQDSPLKGRYLERKIRDNTFLNFASLILDSPENSAFNLPRIRASLAILKDGQAVFTNLEKVYLYRYVFCKGQESDDRTLLSPYKINALPDPDIRAYLERMEQDRLNPAYASNTVFQDKLLWIARSYASRGIRYVEISDTTLVKRDAAPEFLRQAHAVLPAIERETGVTLRFLAAFRRTPLTIIKDQIVSDTMQENLLVLRSIAGDPYVAGSDIIGEEINDIRELSPLISEIVHLAASCPGFVIRIHAGENDGLRDNVLNSLRCVTGSLAPGQPMPALRIGHGLYTANLSSAKGRQLMQALADTGTVLEFQISSNVRLNNLTSLENHPLKTYLNHGVACVQGTDGGALYGTDSIDEELSLEKLLNLSRDDLLAMRKTEQAIYEKSMKVFRDKTLRFERDLKGQDVRKFYEDRIASIKESSTPLLARAAALDSLACLQDEIAELPLNRVPVMVLGGSFNQDTHTTRLHPDILRMLDDLLEGADPEKCFFVIGPSLKGYEKYLLEKGRGKYDFYAFVPSRITHREAEAIKREGLKIRVSIEPARLAVYKSFAFEIFKRRPSVLICLDGNTAGTNMIQEAKNGKRKCHIFVSSHARALRAKAMSLEGYCTLFDGRDAVPDMIRAVETCYPENWYRQEES